VIKKEERAKIYWKSALYLSKLTVYLFDLRTTRKNPISETQLNVLFIPYGANDCQTIHKMFANQLKATGKLKVTVYNINSHGRIDIDSESNELLYSEKISSLFRSNLGHEIWRGMADDYRRRCEVDEFFERSNYNRQIIEQIQYLYKEATNLVEKYDVFILPDLAYTFNRTIHSLAKNKNKKIYILNPHGQLLNASSAYRYPSQTRTVNELDSQLDGLSETKKRQLLDLATDYLNVRLKGNLKSDREAIRAFNPSEETNQLSSHKILMLHCIRDASRELPMEELNFKMECQDYFIWTERMFQKISEDQEQWKIKIHPSSSQYPGEIEIIEKLAKKYSINEKCFKNVPSTAQIIKSKNAVFTYSGTIAMETAANGFKSFVFGNTYPNWLAKKIDFSFISDTMDVRPELLKKDDSSRALILLFLSAKQNRPIYKICPKLSVGPSTSKLLRYKSEFSSSFSLFTISLNIKSQREFRYVCNQLIRDIMLHIPMRIDFIERF
jgi:hypothetical protein